jgi:transcriptional regulator with XRE-family HTH domain
MRTTRDWLAAVKAKHGMTSDYQLSKALHVTRSAVSKAQSGRQYMDDSTAIRVAELLEIDPLEVISSVNAERAKEPRERELWERAAAAFRGTASALFLSALALAGVPGEMRAGSHNQNSGSARPTVATECTLRVRRGRRALPRLGLLAL